MALTMLKPRLATDKRNRLQVQQITRNPEAEQRIRGRKWMEIRERWFRAHPVCVMCEQQGRISLATQLDHRIALINGGKDDESNYQSLCVDHHKEKSAQEAAQRKG